MNRKKKELKTEKKEICSFSLDPDVVSDIERTKPPDISASFHVNSILRQHFGSTSNARAMNYMALSTSANCNTYYATKVSNFTVESMSDADIDLLKKRLGLDKNDK
jgi:hypothetical protein